MNTLAAAQELTAAVEELGRRLDAVEARWRDTCLCRKHAWSPRCPKHGLSAVNPKGSAAQPKDDR